MTFPAAWWNSGGGWGEESLGKLVGGDHADNHALEH